MGPYFVVKARDVNDEPCDEEAVETLMAEVRALHAECVSPCPLASCLSERRCAATIQAISTSGPSQSEARTACTQHSALLTVLLAPQVDLQRKLDKGTIMLRTSDDFEWGHEKADKTSMFKTDLVRPHARVAPQPL
eukprot:1207090-Rhodomonas_salina.1